MPLYFGGPAPAGVDERRRDLAGFVYSPFRAADLFTGIFGATTASEMAFDVYDGDGIGSPDARLYRSDESLRKIAHANWVRVLKETWGE